MASSAFKSFFVHSAPSVTCIPEQMPHQATPPMMIATPAGNRNKQGKMVALLQCLLQTSVALLTVLTFVHKDFRYKIQKV